MKEKKAVAPVDYLWLALLAFGGFGLELLLGMVEPEGPAYLHHILTSMLWGAAAFILWQVGKRRAAFDVLKPGARPGAVRLLAVLVLMAATIGMVSYLWGGFKPVVEFQNAESIIGFVWQYVYYAFEALLIYTTIAFGQRFGDRATKKTAVPWGGIVLALTWGLIHILTQDFLTGMAAVLWALVYGAIYLLCKKNPLYALPAVAITFML